MTFVTFCRQLIVRHAKIYYPVRHHLIQHMVNSMQRLGFSPNVCSMFYLLCLLLVMCVACVYWSVISLVVLLLQAAFDQRKLAVDLADVIIQWEIQRLHDDQEQAAEVCVVSVQSECCCLG
jgi:transformation/transcription domain-associated protein